MMIRTPISAVALLAALAGPAHSQVTRNWYFEPTVVAAGKQSQMARSAKTAINCGFEVVTVRPWREGDIARPDPSKIPRPFSLIVQAAPDSDLNQVVACFERRDGRNGLVRAG
jgi:hypothetical protein